MPPFSDDEIRDNFYIWQMFRDGAVVLVHDTPVLNKLTRDLEDRDYRVVRVDCRFENDRDLDKTLRERLGMEPGWGRDAFNSQMWDLEFPKCTGLVIVLTKIDDFNSRFPKYFWDMTDILAHHCRIRMLTGERLLLILHAENKAIDLDPVGAVGPHATLLRSVPSDSDVGNTDAG